MILLRHRAQGTGLETVIEIAHQADAGAVDFAADGGCLFEAVRIERPDLPS